MISPSQIERRLRDGLSVALAAFASACTLDLEGPIEPSRDAGGVSTPAPSASSSDTNGPAVGTSGSPGVVSDPIRIRDAGPSGNCGETLGSYVVALYPFEKPIEDSVIAESTGRHPGEVVGSVLSPTAGPPGCGNAVQFPEDNSDTYIVVPHSPMFELSQGSIDFWLNVPAGLSGNHGLVSKNARDFRVGHLEITLEAGRVYAHVEQYRIRVSLRTEPVQRDRWLHVGVNLGPPGPELYLNGVLQSSYPTNEIWGLVANPAPLVIGANNDNSAPGATDSVRWFAKGISLDHVRVSTLRRDFPTLYNGD